MSFSSRSDHPPGFTLLEILIAMSILAFISLGIYQATTQTFKLRDVLSVEGDFYNEIRMAMGVMQRDVEQIYSPTLLMPKPGASPSAELPPPPNAQELDAMMSPEMNQVTDFWGAALDKTGIRPSRFIGTDNKLSFVTVSHFRMYKESPESYFAKVTYSTQADTENKNAPGSSILVKTENTNAFSLEDNRDDKFLRRFSLLHGVKSIHFRYWRKIDGGKWETAWDSDKEDFKNIYPDYIEIKIDVAGPSNLTFQGIYKFRPEVPLRGLEPST